MAVTWYSRANGETSGPFSESQVIDLVRRHGDLIELAPARSKSWLRPSATEFATHIPENPVAPPKSDHSQSANISTTPKGPITLKGVLIASALLVGGMVINETGVLGSTKITTANSLEARPKGEEPVVEPPPEVTLKSQLDSTNTLAGALIVLRAHLKDAVGTPDLGAVLLAIWSTKHLTWKDLTLLPKTSRALVLKDSEAERGKSLCAEGSINQITADHSAGPGQTIYEGGIVTSSMAIVRFLAVGSTGTLIENSNARFCGVVTGRYSYPNTGGGTTHAVQMVGFFDLPENRKAATQ